MTTTLTFKDMDGGWRTPRKNANRMRAVQHGDGLPPVSRAIVFPGRQALDVAAGVTSGLFNPETTRLLAIEGKPEIVRRMKASLRALGFSKGFGNLVVVARPLFDVELGEVFGREPVDYAFFDLCGDLKWGIVQWLDRHSSYFVQGTRVALTARADSYRTPRMTAAAIVVGRNRESLFDQKLIRKLARTGRNWDDGDPSPCVVKRKVQDVVRLNAHLLQGAFSRWVLKPRSSQVYYNGEDRAPGAPGRTRMMFLDTELGGANRDRTQFVDWFNAVKQVAAGLTMPQAHEICAEYYGAHDNVPYALAEGDL